MTGLIIFIIVSLLGYFFSDSKQSSKRKPAKQKGPNKGLNDYFEQIKEKMAEAEKELQKNTPTVKRTNDKRMPDVVKSRTNEERVQVLTDVSNNTRTRQQRREEKVEKIQVEKEVHHENRHPLFRNRDDVKRAVIVAEILGPPKAKRK